jgi:polyphosphate kinase
MILDATDTEETPWHIVRSDDKRRARLNCIAQHLDIISYKQVHGEKVKLPKRSDKTPYDDQTTFKDGHFVPEKY